MLREYCCEYVPFKLKVLTKFSVIFFQKPIRALAH